MNLKEIFLYTKTGKFWKELFLLTFGAVLVSAAVYYFLVPTKLVIASISGLGIVIDTLASAAGINIGIAWWLTILNVFLVIVGFLLIGKEFGAKTVFVSVVQGPILAVMEKVYPYTRLLTEPGQISVMNDLWLDVVCFVLLIGIAQAILFRINACSGGLDIVAKIMNKYLHIDIGDGLVASGFVVGLSAALINPFRMVMIGLIGTWIDGIVVNYFMASLNRRKRVCIISDESEAIRKFIVEELVRGCSLYEVTGGYKGEKRIEIQALLTNDEFAFVMEFIKRHNIEAFITAGNVSEVYGKWFKHRYQHYKNIKED